MPRLRLHGNESPVIAQRGQAAPRGLQLKLPLFSPGQAAALRLGTISPMLPAVQKCCPVATSKDVGSYWFIHSVIKGLCCAINSILPSAGANAFGKSEIKSKK